MNKTYAINIFHAHNFTRHKLIRQRHGARRGDARHYASRSSIERVSRNTRSNALSMYVCRIYIMTVQCNTNASFAYQFCQLRRHSLRKRPVPRPARSANETVNDTRTREVGERALAFARLTSRAKCASNRLFALFFILLHSYVFHNLIINICYAFAS